MISSARDSSILSCAAFRVGFEAANLSLICCQLKACCADALLLISKPVNSKLATPKRELRRVSAAIRRVEYRLKKCLSICKGIRAVANPAKLQGPMDEWAFADIGPAVGFLSSSLRETTSRANHLLPVPLESFG